MNYEIIEELKFKSETFKSIFLYFFYKLFFMCIYKNVQDLLAKYYQENKKKSTKNFKKNHERY